VARKNFDTLPRLLKVDDSKKGNVIEPGALDFSESAYNYFAGPVVK
jgi:hypothetical protein